jgi:uncharacterized protein YdeI (YjbR/CyaY-like superfamily)
MALPDDGLPLLHPRSTAVWRQWLEKNGAKVKAVRVILKHKGSAAAGITFPEAVEQALCFGWVDSRADKRDADSYHLVFTPRRSGSSWSQVNKERVARLTAAGLMRPAGEAAVDDAKRTGRWDALNDADAGAVPPDLQRALKANATARAHFEGFPPSSKRLILAWIAKAKQPATRERRIARTVELAAENIRANHPKRY